MIAFTIKGDKELIRKLGRLKASVQKKIVRRAVTAAIRPIRMKAKSDTPKETGMLKKGIAVKVKAYKSGNVFGMVSVKNEKDAATGRRPSKYLHLVSLGTKPHMIHARRKQILVRTAEVHEVLGKFVLHPGTKPNDFLKQAIESKRTEAIAKFSEIVASGIIAEAKKS